MAGDAALLYLLAATLPFPVLGIPLNEFFVLSLSSVVGFVFAVRRVSRFGLRGLHMAALAMLVVFAATALPRHPLSSFVLSLGALGLAMAPLTSPVTSERDIAALVAGLLLGLKLSILSIGISIVIQLVGIDASSNPIAGLFVKPEMGVFLGYVRPAGGCTEPAMLAIYLTAVYVVLDLLRKANRYTGRLGPVVMLSIFFTGSLSGIVLIVSYLAAKVVFGWRTALVRGVSPSLLAKMLVGVAVVAIVIASAGSTAFDFAGDYTSRLMKTQEDIETLNLVGSEGSRINAVRALPDYWDAAGVPGFLFGTGYANYQQWLLFNYGYLGDWSTFARGQIDNIMVAVFLSTGVFGFAAYLVFLTKAFSVPVIKAEFPLLVFILALNFSFGFLISGLYWNLLFVLASVARYAVRCRAGGAEAARKTLRHVPPQSGRGAGAGRELEGSRLA